MDIPVKPRTHCRRGWKLARKLSILICNLQITQRGYTRIPLSPPFLQIAEVSIVAMLPLEPCIILHHAQFINSVRLLVRKIVGRTKLHVLLTEGKTG